MWVRMLLFTSLLAFAGCSNSGTSKDGGTTTSAVDMECPPRACVPEPDEDCAGCFEKIGTCCYHDRNWGDVEGTLELLTDRCKESATCTACCNECTQMTCDAMKKRAVCPFLE